MGWMKVSLAGAGVLMASVAVLAITPQAGQADKKEQESARPSRERVIVNPRIEIFQGGGARLGVGLRDLDEAAAKEHKLTSLDGALVASVEPGSAAEKAGVKAGDVITSFDGERVRSVRQLQRLVADTPAGRQVKVGLLRDGRKTELTIAPDQREEGWILPGGELRSEILERNLDRLRDLPRAFRFDWDEQAPGDIVPRPRTPRAPEAPSRRSPFNPRWPLYEWSSGAGRLGVVVQEMTPQLGEYFGAKTGVLVASVTEDSPAAHAGVKAGDVITSVNGKGITDADSLRRAVRDHPDGQELSLGILRDRKAQTLKVKLLSSHAGRPI